MALVTDLPTNYNILSPVGYRLQIVKLPLVSYFCQNANIPDVSLGTLTRSNPVRDYPEPGDQLEFGTFDISFIVDEDLNNYMEILTWLREISGTPDVESFGRLANEDSGFSTVTDITLTLLTNSMNPNKSVLFTDCFPTSIGAVSFMSSTPALDPILCDVSFAFVDFTIKNEL